MFSRGRGGGGELLKWRDARTIEIRNKGSFGERFFFLTKGFIQREDQKRGSNGTKENKTIFGQLSKQNINLDTFWQIFRLKLHFWRNVLREGVIFACGLFKKKKGGGSLGGRNKWGSPIFSECPGSITGKCWDKKNRWYSNLVYFQQLASDKLESVRTI